MNTFFFNFDLNFNLVVFEMGEFDLIGRQGDIILFRAGLRLVKSQNNIKSFRDIYESVDL